MSQSLDLRPLLAPRSIAIVGASDESGPSSRIAASLEAFGFAGEIYPVNPRRQFALGRTCAPSLTALATPPDAALLCIGPERVAAAVLDAAAAGVKAVVSYASGVQRTQHEGQAIAARNPGSLRTHQHRVLRPRLHGGAEPGHVVVAVSVGTGRSARAGRRCRVHHTKRLDGDRDADRLPSLRLQPCHFNRCGGGAERRALPACPGRRSGHQGHCAVPGGGTRHGPLPRCARSCAPPGQAGGGAQSRQDRSQPAGGARPHRRHCRPMQGCFPRCCGVTAASRSRPWRS